VYSEALVLARKAHEWVVGTFQSVLGPVHTTKLHSLSAHLLAEFRLRGNLHDGNSAYNEELHKFVKAAYKTTNRKRGQFAEQMIINEAVSRLLREDEEEELLEQELGEDQSSSSSRCDDEAPRRQCRSRRRRRLQSRRKYSKKRTLAQLASSRAAPGIPAVLQRSAELDQESGLHVLEDALLCDESTLFCTCPTLYFGDASAPRRGRMQHTIRCAPSFHGEPWMDWLRYRGRDGILRVGQVVFVLTTRARGWQRLLVRRAGSAVPRPECALTKYGRERLQWDVADDATVRLDVIGADDVVGLLAVEYDWEDLCERHGVMVMPTDVPRTKGELRATRFFVNAFVRMEDMVEDDEEEGEAEEGGGGARLEVSGDGEEA